LTARIHAHKRFPERLAFTLNNPIRRRLSPPEQLISKLRVSPNDVVVDFGCGPGFFLIPLARVAGKATGIDVSTSMLEKARNYARKVGVTIELLQSNGAEITLPGNSVDLIFLAHVFHEVEEKPRVLKEFSRILRGSGRLAIVERTIPGGLFSRKFGPPIVKEGEIVAQLQQAGFAFIQTIPHERDSIIIAKK